MNFWNRVKDELEKQKSSFRYIADILNTNESTISTWRSRGVLPRADDAVKIARALGTSVEYLVTGESSNQAEIELNEIKEKLKNLYEST